MPVGSRRVSLVVPVLTTWNRATDVKALRTEASSDSAAMKMTSVNQVRCRRPSFAKLWQINEMVLKIVLLCQ